MPTTSRRRPRAPAALSVTACGIGALVCVPILYVFARAADAGLSGYLGTVLSRSGLEFLGSTLLLVAGVVAVTVAVSVPLAWLVVASDLPERKVWAALAALPLVFPSYISAFALVAVFGPKGFLQQWLAPLGVERLPGIAYGYSGALLALSLFTYPYVYLLLVVALRGIDPALEESARSLGTGRWRAFLRVTLPQLRAPIVAGSLLVALYALSDFGAVSIVRYNTLTLSIYTAYRSLFDRGVAASMSTVLILLALALIAVQAGLLRGARRAGGSPARPRKQVPLGSWRWPCRLLMASWCLLTLGVPVAVILFWCLRALVVGNPLGEAWGAAWNSTAVSILAALAAVALALPVARWSSRYPSFLSRAVERVSYSGFALPGLVIALSLVFLATRHLSVLYQSLALLVAAYVIRFLPESLSAACTALAGVEPTYEEAGRSLGRGPLAVVRTVTLPLIRPGLLAGFGLVFLTSMKELPATLILRPIGFETLATRIWSTAAEGIFSKAALPALLLLLVSAPPLYWLAIRPALAGRSS